MNFQSEAGDRECETSSQVNNSYLRDRVEADANLQSIAVLQRALSFPRTRTLCALDDAGERTLEMTVRRMGLNAHAHDRIKW